MQITTKSEPSRNACLGISRFAYSKEQVIAQMQQERAHSVNEYQNIVKQKLNSNDPTEIERLRRVLSENVAKRSALDREIDIERNRLRELQNDYNINRCDSFLGQFPGR